jgi:hypothetical protein
LLILPLFSVRVIENLPTSDVARTCVPPHACASNPSISTTRTCPPATGAGCGTLTYQGNCSFSGTRTTQAGDADPLVNTVNVLYHPTGWPNDITASDSHAVNLFQPAVSIEKTGNALSKISDSVTYHFKITKLSKATDVVNYTLTLNNTSSADSPDLTCTITDTKLGVSRTVTPKSGAGDTTNVAYTVQAGDADPLTNTASVRCSPAGFPSEPCVSVSAILTQFFLDAPAVWRENVLVIPLRAFSRRGGGFHVRKNTRVLVA